MSNRFANGRKAFGFCDVCGFRFDLKRLKNLVVKTKETQIKACPQCWTPDQPQLQLGMYPISDPQAIRDPRPDTNTWFQSGVNALNNVSEGMLVIQWGWAPIGGARDFTDPLTPNTLVGVGEIGEVSITNVPPLPGSDPYYAYVKLLLHMDGTSGSTTFVDNSPVGYTINVFGNAQIDTANVKFGTGSLLADGTGDYLQIDTSVSGFITAAASDPWTAELWVYATPPSNIRWNSPSASRFTLGITDGVNTDFLLPPATSPGLAVTGYPINTAAWNFVAVVNDPLTAAMRLYINGNEVASQTTKPLVQMGRVSAPSTQSFNGNIDDVRITVGVARYTTNFTPPTAPFPDF
jgi:hypothetical protein